MANEVEILTENAAGTSWVDLTPNAVSTGYQAQNTNIEGNRNGIDASYIRYDSGTDEIVIPPSGPIDVNGLPFSVKSEIRLSNPGAGTWYFRVIDGASSTQKSIETTSDKGTWSASKNALYDGSGNRVLNWVFYSDDFVIDVYKTRNHKQYIENDDINVGNKYISMNNDVIVNMKDFILLASNLISKQFSGPGTSVSAIAYDSLNNNLVSCESGTRNIYVHNGISSTILNSFAPVGAIESITGATYNKDTDVIIVCDDIRNGIYNVDLSTESILSSFGGPGSTPSGVVYDIFTGNLISCDFTTDRIYVHNGVSNSILTSFPSPSTSPRDLSMDYSTGNLISCDSNSDTIYIHDGVSSAIICYIDSKGSSVSSTEYNKDEKNFLSSDSGTNTIYVHYMQLYKQ